jgi:ribosomal protein S18 acetylase RimI-like enzyme
MQIPLPPFPANRHKTAACTHLLSARGLSLREATLDDLPFMRGLYGQLRADEVKQIPWPETVRHQFLDNQFSLQHHHFVTHYEKAVFYVVLHQGNNAGRLYLLREPPYFLIIDIALLPEYRRQGMGSALLSWVKALTVETGAHGIDLHVDQRNPDAQRLYARQGFALTRNEGPYLGMRWLRNDLPQLNTA